MVSIGDPCVGEMMWKVFLSGLFAWYMYSSTLCSISYNQDHLCFDEKHTMVAGTKKKLPSTGRNFEQDQLADLQAGNDKEITYLCSGSLGLSQYR